MSRTRIVKADGYQAATVDPDTTNGQKYLAAMERRRGTKFIPVRQATKCPGCDQGAAA